MDLVVQKKVCLEFTQMFPTFWTGYLRRQKLLHKLQTLQHHRCVTQIIQTEHTLHNKVLKINLIALCQLSNSTTDILLCSCAETIRNIHNKQYKYHNTKQVFQESTKKDCEKSKASLKITHVMISYVK